MNHDAYSYVCAEILESFMLSGWGVKGEVVQMQKVREVEISVHREIDSFWNTDGYVVTITAGNPRRLPTEHELTEKTGVRFYLRNFVYDYESRVIEDLGEAISVALKLADWLQC